MNVALILLITILNSVARSQAQKNITEYGSGAGSYEQNVCGNISCYNNGTCNTLTGECDCLQGFAGLDCSYEEWPFFECLNYTSTCPLLGNCSSEMFSGHCYNMFNCMSFIENCHINDTCDEESVDLHCICAEEECQYLLLCLEYRESCIVNGSCHNETLNSKCGCTEDTCTDKVVDCTNYACYNGVCNDFNGVCECYDGFGGLFCEYSLCDHNGECEDYTYPNGYNCSYHSCHHNGTCNVLTGECECPFGYEGHFCEYQPWQVTECWNYTKTCSQNSSCSNETVIEHCEPMLDCLSSMTNCAINGSCKDPEMDCMCRNESEGDCYKTIECMEYTTQCHYNDSKLCDYNPNPDCDCLHGFCETVNCSNYRCFNNGTCDSYTGVCQCSKGFEGYFCEHGICNPHCQYGHCYQGKCHCNYGYTGEACETMIGAPCGKGYCFNGGVCNNDTNQCDCPFGLAGPDCDSKACFPECNEGMHCDNGYCRYGCPYGYEGANCTEKLSQCNHVYCYNGGQCVNNLYCECPPQFTGPTCQSVICDAHCFNGGTCIDGHCACALGYGGINCEKLMSFDEFAICTTTFCQNRGSCTDTGCMCADGFTGEHCENEICDGCPGDPFGHCYSGRCLCMENLEGIRNHTGCDDYYTLCDRKFPCLSGSLCGEMSCICQEGYSGIYCQERSCDPPCMNHGICVNGECVCDGPFEGDQCEIAPERCGEGHCLYGGTCDQATSTCICPPSLTGQFCETRQCDFPCENGGICLVDHFVMQCICPPGYGGFSCEKEVTTCGQTYCANNGTCSRDSSCECPHGFTGEHCEDVLCTSDCSKRGLCINNNCVCDQGYGGIQCEDGGTKCGSTYCMNGGVCEDDICICPKGFTGATCSLELCANGCPLYGYCYKQECYCNKLDDYYQQKCDKYWKMCYGHVCLNGGNCSQDGLCKCPHRFGGLHCEQQLCLPRCRNGGECSEGECICPEGWEGEACQKRKQGPKGYSCLNETESFSHDQAQDGTTDFVFMWPETAVGGVARLQCPCTSNPNLTARIFAVKKCIGSDTWSATDWASCQLSPSLHRLCTASTSDLLSVIRNSTSNVKEMGSGDVALLASVVDSLASDENLQDEDTRDSLLSIVDDILSVEDEVLEETGETSDTSGKITDVFERIAEKSILRNGVLKVRKENFVLEVKSTNITDIPTEGFIPDFAVNSSNKATLPKSIFNELNLTGSTSVRISSSVIEKSTLFQGQSSSTSVVSAIISLSVVGIEVKNLKNPIVLEFQKTTTEVQIGWKTSCQYWDKTKNDGLGEWSEDGCSVLEEAGDNVKCGCNHLTSFATLQVEVDSEDSSADHQVAVEAGAIAGPTVAVCIVIVAAIAVVILIVFISRSAKSRTRMQNIEQETNVIENPHTNDAIETTLL